jgi:hypothetical protein
VSRAGWKVVRPPRSLRVIRAPQLSGGVIARSAMLAGTVAVRFTLSEVVVTLSAGARPDRYLTPNTHRYGQLRHQPQHQPPTPTAGQARHKAAPRRRAGPAGGAPLRKLAAAESQAHRHPSPRS